MSQVPHQPPINQFAPPTSESFKLFCSNLFYCPQRFASIESNVSIIAYYQIFFFSIALLPVLDINITLRPGFAAVS